MTNLIDKISLNTIGKLLAGTMIVGGVFIGVKGLQLSYEIGKLGEAMGQLAGTNRKPALIVRVVDGLGRLLEKKNTYQISNEDLITQEAEKIYNQKLAQYGDLNNDNMITPEEQEKFGNDITTYGDFRTKNYKGRMPKQGSKKFLELGIDWMNDYTPNWKEGGK